MILEAGGNELAPEIRVAADRYVEGDVLLIAVLTLSIPSYLHLAYFQADGSVVNLMQSSPQNLRTLQPSTLVRMGDGQNGRPTFRIGGPFGPEMLLAITSKSPLFESSRPQVETEREFLTALRAATIDLEKQGFSRFLSADDQPIETNARGKTDWMPEEYTK